MKVKSLFFFDNGNIAAFDENEQQIPSIQSQNWLKLYFAFLVKTMGISTNDIEEIKSPKGNDVKAWYGNDN